MSEIQVIKASTKDGSVVAEFELELPTDFDELEILPGKEKTLSMVRNAMKIEGKRMHKPSKSRPGALPKSAQRRIRDAVAAGVSLDDIMEFVRKKHESRG